jgi:hypothetical protein
VVVLSVDHDVLPATFGMLRCCGGGQRECVVYWLGPVDDPDRVDGILQPQHEADYDWYEVDSTWVTEFYLELRASRRSVRAQIHTHPAASVRHSRTDDAFVIAPSTGFLSIVLPYFATGHISLAGAYATEIGSNGTWLERRPEEVIQWI